MLCRTRSGLSACEQMLRRAGVPCYMDARDGYFDALEVRIMLGLMRAVENRRRDMPLLEVLRSPVMGCGSTDLARIRMHTPQGPFYEAVQNYARLDSPLAHRLAEFLDKLDRWRLLSRVLPLGEWVNRLMMESGYYAYAGGMPGGRTRQGNLDLLCGYANQLDALQPGGLTAFLEYVEEIGRTGGDMGTAHTLGEGDDVVRLTVHQSRAEFPIVFRSADGRSLGGAGSQGCFATAWARASTADRRWLRRNSLPGPPSSWRSRTRTWRGKAHPVCAAHQQSAVPGGQLQVPGGSAPRMGQLGGPGTARELPGHGHAGGGQSGAGGLVSPQPGAGTPAASAPRRSRTKLTEKARAMCWQYPHADAALLP